MKVASLSQELSVAGSEIRILPAGAFRATDGRPQGLSSWNVNAAIANRIIVDSLASGADILIDYEHQSLHAAKNGLPVPAAGWFNRMEWREGVGMFALDIRWNERAKTMIAAREYRYISPVFSFAPDTGDVQRILSVAITNIPALPQLADLSTVAVNNANFTSARERPQFTPSTNPHDQRGMELLRRMVEL